MFTIERPPLPEIGSSVGGIYKGKYSDRSPGIIPAGKISYAGYDIKSCLKTPLRPQSPEAVRRFRASLQPDAGRMRIFYGKAYDPHRKWAEQMTHGIHRDPSYTGGELLNPKPKTTYQQRIIDRKETVYQSHKRYPLGTSHDQRPHLPPGMQPALYTFGVKSFKDDSAGVLVSPNKTYEQVDEEHARGHGLYVKSHRSYSASEQVNRNYRAPGYRAHSCFGVPTPHENDGRHVRKTMKWVTDTQAEKAAPIVANRLDMFREKTQPQLGKVLDPIKDTMNVPDDHTFGILLKPDEYGVGDLLHCRAKGNYLRGRENIRGMMSAIRHHLKNENYNNFDGLLQAFKFYDKTGDGKITMDGLRDVCIRFSLPVEPEILVELMDCCDVNRDGLIDYTEFANFLNWKDNLTEDFPPDKVARGSCAANDGSGGGGSDGAGGPSGTNPAPPSPALSTPRRLEKQIDKAITDQRTSASMINAVVGGISTKGYRKYGTPTIRSDLSAPTSKRVGDTRNYGDEGDAHGLVNPSIYNQHGVDERDFLGPRSKEELRQIFTVVCGEMPTETFDKLYEDASRIHPKNYVSVESFRTVLGPLMAGHVEGKLFC